MSGVSSEVQALANQKYQYGFVTDLETDAAPRGLNEDIAMMISAKTNKPDWLFEWVL
jgi:Fe-S cluster assembly protein SufB